MINAIKERRGLFEGSGRGRDKRSDNGAETCRVAKGVRTKSVARGPSRGRETLVGASFKFIRHGGNERSARLHTE